MSAEQISSFVEMQEMFQREYYILIGMIALLGYDYILTIEPEIRLIWPKMFRVSTVFYFIARYLPFGPFIFYLVPIAPGPKCNLALRSIEVLHLIVRATMTATLILQTYALYLNRNKVVLLVLGFIGTALIAFDCLQMVSLATCTSGPIPIWQLWINSITRLVFLSCLTAILVFKAYKLRKSSVGRDNSLAVLIFRSGMSYFFIIFTLEFLYLVFSLVPSLLANNVWSLFNVPLGAIMIARFLLNLRDISDNSNGGTTNRFPSTLPEWSLTAPHTFMDFVTSVHYPSEREGMDNNDPSSQEELAVIERQ